MFETEFPSESEQGRETGRLLDSRMLSDCDIKPELEYATDPSGKVLLLREAENEDCIEFVSFADRTPTDTNPKDPENSRDGRKME
jgi:hypothetical protein